MWDKYVVFPVILVINPSGELGVLDPMTMMDEDCEITAQTLAVSYPDYIYVLTDLVVPD